MYRLKANKILQPGINKIMNIPETYMYSDARLQCWGGGGGRGRERDGESGREMVLSQSALNLEDDSRARVYSVSS